MYTVVFQFILVVEMKAPLGYQVSALQNFPLKRVQTSL